MRDQNVQDRIATIAHMLEFTSQGIRNAESPYELRQMMKSLQSAQNKLIKIWSDWRLISRVTTDVGPEAPDDDLDGDRTAKFLRAIPYRQKFGISKMTDVALLQNIHKRSNDEEIKSLILRRLKTLVTNRPSSAD